MHLTTEPVVKKVQFNDKVTCLKLVAPTEIYHCSYPKTIPLKDESDPPIRKLQHGIYCVSRKCKLLLPSCYKESACDECIGSARV